MVSENTKEWVDKNWKVLVLGMILGAIPGFLLAAYAPWNSFQLVFWGCVLVTIATVAYAIISEKPKEAK